MLKCIKIGGYNVKYIPFDDYSNVGSNLNLALVPIQDFTISNKYTIGDIVIYPSGTLNSSAITAGMFDASFQELEDSFFNSTILAFPIDYDPKNVLGSELPELNQKLIKSTLDKAEEVMNVFRFFSSNIAFASNLPQRAGYLKDEISGFIICRQFLPFIFKTSKFQCVSRTLGSGLALDESDLINFDRYFRPFTERDAPLSGFLKHSYRLYSDILYLPSTTNKFMQAMSELEYLANPYKYEKMQDVKKKIAVFSATSREEYDYICDRFQLLTSKEDDDGNQIGLRTSIVHNGKILDDLFEHSYEVNLLLRELQMYICNSITSYIPLISKNWEEVEEIVKIKRSEILANSRERVSNQADVVIIIDCDFLNLALEQVYHFYPHHINKKIDINMLITGILRQTTLSRSGYSVPVQLFYTENNRFFNSTEDRYFSDYDGLGFESAVGDIHFFYSIEPLEKIRDMRSFLEIYLTERNVCLEISSKFDNIVWISDRNKITTDFLEGFDTSPKNIILGRLENTLTTCYDKSIWFDIEILIMGVLGITITEECVQDFIFRVEDGSYD